MGWSPRLLSHHQIGKERKSKQKNCTIDKLKFAFIEILLCSNFVEFNVLLLLSVSCIICGLPWPDLQASCDSPHPAMQIWSFDSDNKSKSANCRSTNLSFFLSFFLLKQCQRIWMSFEWFSFLETENKRKEPTST